MPGLASKLLDAATRRREAAWAANLPAWPWLSGVIARTGKAENAAEGHVDDSDLRKQFTNPMVPGSRAKACNDEGRLGNVLRAH